MPSETIPRFGRYLMHDRIDNHSTCIRPIRASDCYSHKRAVDCFSWLRFVSVVVVTRVTPQFGNEALSGTLVLCLVAGGFLMKVTWHSTLWLLLAIVLVAAVGTAAAHPRKTQRLAYGFANFVYVMKHGA
jgi:chromate transport protein ChrA